MMRINGIIIICSWLLACCNSKVEDKFGKPIMYYTHSNPWSWGASQPLFVVYNNGIILYRKNNEYKEVQISEKDKNDILSYCTIDDSALKRSSTASDTVIVEKSWYTLTLNVDSTRKIIYHGDLNNQKERANAPAPLLKLHDFIMNYTNEKARSWFPDKVAVYAQNYGNALEPSIKWPADWPDLSSSQSKKVNEHVSVIYLDKKYFNDLKTLLVRRGTTQAFEINNRKYYLYYKLPIPGIDSVYVQ